MSGMMQGRGRLGLLAVGLVVVLLRYAFLDPFLIALVVALAVMGARELYRMGAHLDQFLSLPLMVTAAGLTALSGAFVPALFDAQLPVAILLFVIVAFALHMYQFGYEKIFTSVPVTLMSVVYVGLPMALTLQVWRSDRIWLLTGLAMIWMTDTGAYFAGKQWGRTPLAPKLSPKKTREGLLGGIAASVATGLLLAAFFPSSVFRFTYFEVIVTGLLIGMVGPLGDLAESSLKRDSGIKDSGTSMGGHGGVLDRIDSLLFCAPILYLVLRWKGFLI